MKWDLKKLNKLCKTKKLPDSKVYQKALVWKREIALFHSEQSTIVWDKLFCAHQKLIVGDKKWWDTYLASEAHVIAAAVIGGASLEGGKGDIIATFFGASIITIEHNGLNLHAVPTSVQNIVVGMIIIFAVFIDMWRRNLGDIFSRLVAQRTKN